VSSDTGFDLSTLVRDYGDIRAEARSCRSASALFDFSFMRRMVIIGPGAQAMAQSLTSRPIGDMQPGRIRYALSPDASGHVLGDITIWRLDADTFEVFAGTGEMFAELNSAAGSAASVRDLSEETAIFSVQGPSSLRVLSGVADVARISALPYFAHVDATIAGAACRVGRLGYTGERGFEIIAPREAAAALWAMLSREALPAGFAAADILRIEAGFALFANEFAFPVTAAELGLARFAGEARREQRVRLVAFTAECDGEPILWRPSQETDFPPPPGRLVATSACRSIVTGAVLGLGYANVSDAAAQLSDPAGQFRSIRNVALPVYDLRKLRPRGGWRADLFPIA
jgi:aminomethyltransferase